MSKLDLNNRIEALVTRTQRRKQRGGTLIDKEKRINRIKSEMKMAIVPP
jgi:hypothetical protein